MKMIDMLNHPKRCFVRSAAHRYCMISYENVTKEADNFIKYF